MSQENISLKQKIANIVSVNGETLDEKEYTNLVLDQIPITEFSAEDKEYLNTFQNLNGKLCMNDTNLKNLNNLPDKLKIVRVSTN